MRIALISNTLPPEGTGGAEAHVALLAAALSREHEVLVLTGATAGELRGRGEIAVLPALPPLARTAPQAHKLLWHARDQWLPRTFLAASRALRQFDPDVVHTHECQGLSAAVFTAIERARLPHVHTAHDLNLLCARVTMTRDGEFCGGRCNLCRIQRFVRGRSVRRHITTLVSVSEYIQRHHLAAGVVPPAQATIVRLGAQLGPPREPSAQSEGLHVGFIGAVARYKGVQTLLDAFAKRRDPLWRLTVAGRGELEETVKRAAAEDPRISYLGQVDGEAKGAFFSSLDVLAVPSEWEEPGATVATEAIAHGLPTIVSDRGGLPEIAEAYIFRSGDVESLLAGLDWLAEHRDERVAIAGRLLARRREFSWDRHYDEISAILDEAASQKPLAGRPRTQASSRSQP